MKKTLLLLITVFAISSCSTLKELSNELREVSENGLIDTTNWEHYKTTFRGKNDQHMNMFFKQGAKYYVKVYYKNTLCNEVLKIGFPLTKKFYSCRYSNGVTITN